MIGTLIAKGKVRSAFKFLNQRNADVFLANWAEDATWIYPGNLSVSGEIKGKKAIEEWFRKFMDQFPRINFTIKHICLQNICDVTGTNHIVVEWDVQFTNKDGKETQNSGVTTIELKMGKAVLARDYIFNMDEVKTGWREG
jgi:ketosteroid isomerase-like protein